MTRTWWSFRIFARRLAGGVAMALLASCAISQQQEVELGASTAEQVAAERPLIKDAAIVNYITALGNQLTRAVDTRGLDWHFYMVDSKEVNAFAVGRTAVALRLAAAVSRPG